MFPLLGPMITGGASLLGSIFSSQTSASNTQEQLGAQEAMLGQTEQFNAQQAQQQRDYETQMSNTAYQRSSADMKAAGLNPMMMFGSGSSASTPGGATASVGTPGVPMPTKTNPLAGLGQAAATAVDTMVKDKQIDYLSSQVARTNVGTQLDEAKVPGARAQMELDQYFKAFLEDHPSVAEAMGVGPHIGSAIDETLKPGFDAVSAVYGGLGRVLRGLGGASPSSSGFGGKLSAPAEASSSGSATDVRRGMDLERQLRDMGFKSGPPEADRFYPGN